ncbi:MAG: alpha/beta fold hydrolase [Patescibacteria group bacterium]|jgi:pimeloyl-ACP methyl ester carboxylesterase
MKKIFLIFFGYLFFVRTIFAFEFDKSIKNPLNINYINGYTNHLQANIFKEDGLYKGIFSIKKATENYYSLGYFESANGLDWQMKKEILNIGRDLSNPSVTKTQAGYQLFISVFENGSIYKIYSSACDFDFNCSSNLAQVINPDTSNYSENKGVFAGHPIQQNNQTYLFFGAWGGDGFKIKLAYSDDLINWQRCPNDKTFLYGGDGPFSYKDNNDLLIFFHRSDNSGIRLAKSSLPLSCDSTFEDQGYILNRNKNYDLRHLIFPSVISDQGNLKLFYSGLGDDFQWRLNLACSEQACLSPTLTPTPTSIQILTGSEVPTPTSSKLPIILIPGFLASWNKDSIIHNIDKPQSEWKLNPMAKEYNGIIDTLKKLGYEENINLFVFAYDWRKPILNIVEDLNSFVNTKFPTNDLQIIGHSLGGLVSRIYLQKYNNQRVRKLITAGSPHHGATVAYKIVEAGEIERFNDYLWLAVKMVATLNKNNLETDRQTINRLFPSMKDLFPIYNFLKKDGKDINISEMKIKNELLSYETYKTNGTNLTNVESVVGKKGNTLKGFNVIDQTITDKLFDIYPDGRPQSSFSEIGDYTVLSTSATIGIPIILKLEHGELIYKKEAIKNILNLLNIQYGDEQIVEGKGTIIDSSIMFLIKSPATMEVVINGQTYTERDGMIFIENAQSGDYQLKVKGVDKGKYEVIVGQISKENDLWESISGEITQSPASSQTDNYNILYNSQTALSIKCTGQACLTPTVTPTITPIPTNPIPTSTPIPTPTTTSTSTPFPTLSNSSPEILGISSQRKESITPTIKVLKKIEAKKEIKKSSIWDFILPSLVISILVEVGWFVRKNLQKKSK